MKKILIIANTYYQLIAAMQMNYTIFAKDDIYLIISDHSNNSEVIYERIKNIDIFYKVIFVSNKSLVCNRSTADRMADFFQISFMNRNRYSFYLSELNNLVLDEIITYNLDIDIYGIYAILAKYNKNLSLSIFEEGILSYKNEIDDTFNRKIIRFFWRLFKNIDVEKNYLNFYCFYPKLYLGSLQRVRIPLISYNSDLRNILNSIFVPNTQYKEKYIFFTSVYDFEGGKPVGEYELVCKVAKLVGKKNLLIKMHPRDTRSLYRDNGFNVDNNSSIPWEVIQLSGDFSDKIFMTVNSGSVLSGSTMSEKPVKTFYMYKLCDIEGNPSCKKNARDIENLLNNDSMRNILKTVKIAERLDDIL